MAVMIGGLWMIAPHPVEALITCDLSTAPSTCGPSADTNFAIYRTVDTQPTGTGVIDPFLRSNTNQNQISMYNTATANSAPFNSQADNSFTKDLLLANVPIVTINGVAYRQFLVDSNQNNSNPLISLDNIKVFVSNTGGNTANTDPATTNPSGLGTLIYQLDGNKDNGILIKDINPGSGVGDIFIDIPSSLFDSFSNVYMWTGWGGETTGACAGGLCVNNDGFEEVATQHAVTVVPEPTTLLLVGTMLAGIGAWARRRQLAGRRNLVGA